MPKEQTKPKLDNSILDQETVTSHSFCTTNWVRMSQSPRSTWTSTNNMKNPARPCKQAELLNTQANHMRLAFWEVAASTLFICGSRPAMYSPLLTPTKAYPLFLF
jgi:hypothetical protein